MTTQKQTKNEKALQKRLMNLRVQSFIEKLLRTYCKMNHITVEDIKSTTRERGLPTHRHIFAYCIREHYHIRYKIIGKALMKEQVRYGVKLIRDLLQLFKDKAPNPDISRIKYRIEVFIKVCQLNERPDKVQSRNYNLHLDVETLKGLEGSDEYKEIKRLIRNTKENKPLIILLMPEETENNS